MRESKLKRRLELNEVDDSRRGDEVVAVGVKISGVEDFWREGK